MIHFNAFSRLFQIMWDTIILFLLGCFSRRLVDFKIPRAKHIDKDPIFDTDLEKLIYLQDIRAFIGIK